MQKFNGKSFISREKIEGCEAIGNPASIYLLEDNEEFDRNYMSKIGIEDGKNNIPMAVFIKKIKDLENSYNIYFYQPSGVQAYMCGHGALVATWVLYKKFNLNNVNFYFDLGVYDIRGGKKPDNNLIKTSVKDDKVMIVMNSYHYEKITNIDKDIVDLKNLLNLSDNDIKDIIKGIEFFDLTFVLNDANVLRNCRPNFEAISPILSKLNIRNLCLTAKSKLDEFDFESRVFCPHDDLDEDKVCGSSNLTITKYWNDVNNKDQFKILFPYRMTYTEKLVGGVQFTSINNDIISIGGYCEIY